MQDGRTAEKCVGRFLLVLLERRERIHGRGCFYSFHDEFEGGVRFLGWGTVGRTDAGNLAILPGRRTAWLLDFKSEMASAEE
jgi:hypothetical protein